MAFEDITSPPLLDETGQSIVDALEDIAHAVQYTNIFIQMFPIGSIYMTSNAIPPTFPGVYWEEVVPFATYGELKTNTFHFIPGTGTGSSHYWRSTTAPVSDEGSETP